MSDLASNAPRNSRRRESRPERISLGDEELVRNDIIAKDHGTSERTVNRGDAKGAPYTYIGNVKYRPLKAYRQFLASGIKQIKPPRRRGHS